VKSNSLLKRSWDLLGLNRMVLALSFARMADGIGNSLLFVIIPLYIKSITIDIGLPLSIIVALLISGYGFASVIVQPLIGAASDRWGHDKLFIEIGLLLLGGSTLGFIWASNFVIMLILRILQGIGLAMEIPSTMAILTTATRQETRGGAMGVFTTFRMLGLAIGPIAGGLLHAFLGFNVTFIVASAVLFIAAAIVQFAVKGGRQRREKNGSATSNFLSMINLPIVSVTLATLVMASAFTLISTLENQFNKRLDIGGLEFGIAFSALMIGRLIFQVPFGHFSDKHGRKVFVLGGLIALFPVTALLGIVKNLWEFAGLRFLQGIASAAIISPALAFASDMAESGSEGRQTSIVTMGFSAGLAIGPLIAGFLSPVFFEFPFLIMSGLALCVSVIIGVFMPGKQKNKN
jgi:MFS family permease